MQSLVLYHGTIHQGDMESFWPNSHFGSKSASIVAIAAKWKDLMEAANPDGLPDSLSVEPDPWRRIIEVELAYDVSYCLTTEEDWGNPSTLALSNLLRKISGFEELFNPIYENLFAYKRQLGRDLSREQRTAALRRYGEPLVCKALEKKGVKVIKYRNIVEGKLEDGGYEYSYCVFDPGLLRIRKVDQVQNSDLLDGIKRVLKSIYKSRDFNVTMNSEDCAAGR